MKNFKEFLNENIEQSNLNKISRFIKNDMEKENLNVFLFDIVEFDSKIELKFNFKYELESHDLIDRYKNTLYSYETNAKNLLIEIEKLKKYFKKYKKDDSDFFISKNNYTGLQVQIDLKLEEIINAFDSETGNEIKSILSIDKFNL